MNDRRGWPDRRDILGMIAALTTGGATRKSFAETPTDDSAPPLLGARACLLTPEAVQGPYYFDPKLVRCDIRENKTGVPILLRLQIVDQTCRPIAGARVDVWHCDAAGLYSNYAGQGDNRAQPISTIGESFLRGSQLADDAGVATFKSIYPGWYPGRTPHIHFKAFLNDANILTGQLFFPDALSEFIYRDIRPYSARTAKRDTMNKNDFIAIGAGPGSFASVTEEKQRYLVTLVIGVDPAARSKASADITPQALGPPTSGAPSLRDPKRVPPIVPGMD
ncbi:MAG: intradiol ring-cleavage dioxygenase [Methylocystis sp.]|uniref:intradiol ring-cleavage dioxygenase n=1 Tax=Methylocystis sp. TaxID=1911079 RepID=UPI0039523C83